MKINYFWDKNYEVNQIGIRLNPLNRHLSLKINLILENSKKLNVVDPLSDRKLYIKYDEIYLIEAMDNFSKIYTFNRKYFMLEDDLRILKVKKLMGYRGLIIQPC